MKEENITQEFRLKNIDQTRNCFIEEINQNDLISKKHRKGCRILNYIENWLILAYAVDGCVSISDFASLTGAPIGITSFVIGVKICAITGGMKKCKSIIRTKKKNKHDKIILLAKPRLNSIEVLISKALINLYFSHNKVVLVNNALREYDSVKENIKNLKTLTDHQRFWSIYKTRLANYLKCRGKQKPKSKSYKGRKGRIILVSKCMVCGSKISRFIKKQEARVFVVLLLVL